MDALHRNARARYSGRSPPTAPVSECFESEDEYRDANYGPHRPVEESEEARITKAFIFTVRREANTHQSPEPSSEDTKHSELDCAFPQALGFVRT